MNHRLTSVTREIGMGLPHSTTLARSRERNYLRKVVECDSPMPIFLPIRRR